MQAQKSAAFHRAFTKADLCEYYVNLETNTFDIFKVEPSLMTVFEQSHTWDELVRHFVDSYVAVSYTHLFCMYRMTLYY